MRGTNIQTIAPFILGLNSIWPWWTIFAILLRILSTSIYCFCVNILNLIPKKRKSLTRSVSTEEIKLTYCIILGNYQFHLVFPIYLCIFCTISSEFSRFLFTEIFSGYFWLVISYLICVFLSFLKLAKSYSNFSKTRIFIYCLFILYLI